MNWVKQIWRRFISNVSTFFKRGSKDGDSKSSQDNTSIQTAQGVTPAREPDAQTAQSKPTTGSNPCRYLAKLFTFNPRSAIEQCHLPENRHFVFENWINLAKQRNDHVDVFRLQQARRDYYVGYYRNLNLRHSHR